jgi:dTDP-glucose 4,6-dehydratase
MRVVVTGGAGFIGVVQRTDRVLNVDKLTYAANLSSRAKMACKASYQFAQADIADEARIAGLLKDFELEAIIHLAAETHVDRSIESARAFIQTNVVGTSVLLDSARKYWSDLPSGRQTRFVS